MESNPRPLQCHCNRVSDFLNEFIWLLAQKEIAVHAGDLSLPPPAEDSAEIAARVAAARERQTRRYGRLAEGRRPQANVLGTTVPRTNAPRTNADADGRLLEEVAGPDAEGRRLLTEAAERMKLTARGYHRVLKVARTLADLDSAESVRRIHIAEALSYRRIAPGRF